MHRIALLLLVACSSNTTTPAAGSGSAPAPAPAPKRELMPDPITKSLDETEARSEATRLARQAFDADPKLQDASGKHPKTPAFEPSTWTVKRDGDRWQLDIAAPAGPSAHVELGAFGDHPKVSVGYATE